jgi:cytochrome b561
MAAVSILTRDLVEESALRVLLVQWHRQIGLLVLLAWVARIAARSRRSMAPMQQGPSRLMHLAATAVHWALYALILALPMLGWALSSAHGVKLSLLGVLPLPALMQADPDWADTLTDYHVLASWALLGMVTLHVGAALFHHYVLRDQVLAAMLPAGSRLHPAAQLTATSARQAG